MLKKEAGGRWFTLEVRYVNSMVVCLSFLCRCLFFVCWLDYKDKPLVRPQIEIEREKALGKKEEVVQLSRFALVFCFLHYYLIRIKSCLMLL